MIVRFIFSSILQTWYVEVRISRGTSESSLDFEVTRVDCTTICKYNSCLCSIKVLRINVTAISWFRDKILLEKVKYYFLILTEPLLKITPKYFLKVPTDSYAKFQCTCDHRNTTACEDNKMSWSFTNKHTGVTKDIYRNGAVLESPDTYIVTSGIGFSNISIEGSFLT